MRADVRRALAAAAALALLLLVPAVFSQQLNALFLRMPGIDKAAHVAGYLVVFACMYVVAGLITPERSRRVRLALAAGVTFSIADETIQRVTPGRTIEALDQVANAAGLGLGWVVVWPGARRAKVAVATAALCAAASVTWHTHTRLIDYSRGLRASQEGDMVRARKHFRRAYDSGLRTSALYNELGWTEIESGVGDPDKAVEYARAALALDPGNPDILDTYGWALHHAGRTGEAIAALEQAYAANPRIYCIHYHLGAAYLAAGRREEAESHFRRQVERPGTREAVFAGRALAEMQASQ